MISLHHSLAWKNPQGCVSDPSAWHRHAFVIGASLLSSHFNDKPDYSFLPHVPFRISSPLLMLFLCPVGCFCLVNTDWSFKLQLIYTFPSVTFSDGMLPFAHTNNKPYAARCSNQNMSCFFLCSSKPSCIYLWSLWAYCMIYCNRRCFQKCWCLV